jgi:hypothetical protein
MLLVNFSIPEGNIVHSHQNHDSLSGRVDDLGDCLERNGLVEFGLALKYG